MEGAKEGVIGAEWYWARRAREGWLRGGGGDAAGDAGAGETAVAVRHLVQVLLVVVLGVVEGAGGLDLGRDRLVSRGAERLVVGLPRHLRRCFLAIAGEVDAGAVLSADVVALAHPLGRVVLLEEDLEQVGVGDLLGIEGDEDRLGVAGLARADLLVGRVRSPPAHVSNRRRVDAVQNPEQPLRPPQAAQPE